ncbi:energy-coupling factor ABC transporter ATP-binding protein [Neorhizobium galegae]|uniref:energy-coupling factor ABC transporter ATP-binding protein n=1 Tax=Neorhizobium galegae TaxID=399 RepID=UPI000621E5FF|nr:energy-coupling factor ABC transporter ATP-binding protein [Neorhizobium galegae]UIK06339.1 energy-coupling factor ABC transporter ATP-binding protein [Neorhizobium galegae]CDZ69230.1 ATP-binding protein BioM [Neorhizobium galegae bv. orientalis]
MDILFEQAEARFEGRTVVHPLTLRLSERRIGVIGLNGSGKTTFARMINGLVLPAAGQVTVNGFDTVKGGDRVRGQTGFIFQNPQNQIILPILKEDIALGLKSQKLSKADTEAAVEAVLARFGIAHLGERRAHELSGGELQLAALASVLVTRPDILIMDEPTNQLDLRNHGLVERTIQGLDENVIVISHDLGLIAQFDRVLLFHEGRLAHDGAPAEVIARYRELAA